jgi:hypothetical protein
MYSFYVTKVLVRILLWTAAIGAARLVRKPCLDRSGVGPGVACGVVEQQAAGDNNTDRY